MLVDKGTTLAFLPQSVKTKRRSCLSIRRLRTWLPVFAVLLVFCVLLGRTDKARKTLRDVPLSRPWYTLPVSSSALLSAHPKVQRDVKHLLVPAASQSPDLCKLLLTSSSLQYPHPHLLGWNQTYRRPNQDEGGVRTEAIRQAYKYLRGLGPGSDDDLVVMLNDPNAWFQLKPEVLAERYYEVLRSADARVVKRLGRTSLQGLQGRGLDVELASSIVFAAGKTCEPNEPHTIACYTAPSSPLSPDLFGLNTDSPIGRTKYSSYRPRYLDSAYIIGPVGAMKKLMHSASSTVDQFDKFQGVTDSEPGDPSDNGSHESDHLYRGSAQSIFAKIFGRQSYMREVVRRGFDPGGGGKNDKKKGSDPIEGTPITNILNPTFTHEDWTARYWPGYYPWLERDLDPWSTDPRASLERYDFGIVLDYTSILGHHTRHSEFDGRWLLHSPSIRPAGRKPPAEQVDKATENRFDCTPHLPRMLPSDIGASRFPPTALTAATNVSWSSVPLYTHLCHGSIPAFIHNPTSHLSSSELSARAEPPRRPRRRGHQDPWTHMAWLYAGARHHLLGPSIYEAAGMPPPEYGVGEATGATGPAAAAAAAIGKVDEERQGPGVGGAWTDKGYSMTFGQLCPRQVIKEGKIFGGPDGMG